MPRLRVAVYLCMALLCWTCRATPGDGTPNHGPIEQSLIDVFSAPCYDLSSSWRAVASSLQALFFPCAPQVEDNAVVLPYCGYIAYVTHYANIQHRKWTITLQKYRHFNTSILYMDIPNTDMTCTSAYLGFSHQDRERRYCGRRRPWNMYTEGLSSSLVVEAYRSRALPVVGYYGFCLVYQVLDTLHGQLPQRNLTTWIRTMPIDLTFHDAKEMSCGFMLFVLFGRSLPHLSGVPGMESEDCWAEMSITESMVTPYIDTGVSWPQRYDIHVLVHPIEYACVLFPRAIDELFEEDGLVMYDGPGTLALTLHKKQEIRRIKQPMYVASYMELYEIRDIFRPLGLDTDDAAARLACFTTNQAYITANSALNVTVASGSYYKSWATRIRTKHKYPDLEKYMKHVNPDRQQSAEIETYTYRMPHRMECRGDDAHGNTMCSIAMSRFYFYPITLETFEFKGADLLQQYEGISNCQYGGLYWFMQQCLDPVTPLHSMPSYRVLTLCSDAKFSTPFHYSGSTFTQLGFHSCEHMFLVMYTYKGYSSGRLAIRTDPVLGLEFCAEQDHCQCFDIKLACGHAIELMNPYQSQYYVQKGHVSNQRALCYRLQFLPGYSGRRRNESCDMSVRFTAEAPARVVVDQWPLLVTDDTSLLHDPLNLHTNSTNIHRAWQINQSHAELSTPEMHSLTATGVSLKIFKLTVLHYMFSCRMMSYKNARMQDYGGVINNHAQIPGYYISDFDRKMFCPMLFAVKSGDEYHIRVNPVNDQQQIIHTIVEIKKDAGIFNFDVMINYTGHEPAAKYSTVWKNKHVVSIFIHSMIRIRINVGSGSCDGSCILRVAYKASTPAYETLVLPGQITAIHSAMSRTSLMGSAAHSECPSHAPYLLADTMEDMQTLYKLLPRKTQTFSTFMVSANQFQGKSCSIGNISVQSGELATQITENVPCDVAQNVSVLCVSRASKRQQILHIINSTQDQNWLKPVFGDGEDGNNITWMLTGPVRGCIDPWLGFLDKCIRIVRHVIQDSCRGLNKRCSMEYPHAIWSDVALTYLHGGKDIQPNTDNRDPTMNDYDTILKWLSMDSLPQNITLASIKGKEITLLRTTPGMPFYVEKFPLKACNRYRNRSVFMICVADLMPLNESTWSSPLPLYACPGWMIRSHQVCDGRRDCSNGEDENNCDLCAGPHFMCSHTWTCVAVSTLCDGVPDCRDAEDEVYCPSKPASKERYPYRRSETIYNVPQTWDADAEFKHCYAEKNDTCTGDYCQLFSRYRLCQYDHTSDGALAHCENGQHLMGPFIHACEDVVCSYGYKCLGSYCIPLRKVCDGTADCPHADDEEFCGDPLCPSMLRCYNSSICLPLWEICDGTVDCPVLGEDETIDCLIDCPPDCNCNSGIVDCHIEADYSALYCSDSGCNQTCLGAPISLGENNTVRAVIVNSYDFICRIKPMHTCFVLEVTYAMVNSLMLHDIPLVSKFREVFSMNLRGNSLTHVSADAFALDHLTSLNLAQNRIRFIEANAFVQRSHLRVLILSDNFIKHVYSFYFEKVPELRVLLLDGNPLTFMDVNSLELQQELWLVGSDWYMLCCMASYAKQCTPLSDYFSSCDSLIHSPVLRYIIIVYAILSLANIAILVRLPFEENREKLQQAQLAVAEALMSAYLCIYVYVDNMYKDSFRQIVRSYRQSWVCFLSGLSMYMSFLCSLYLRSFIIIIKANMLTTKFCAKTFQRRMKLGSLCIWLVASSGMLALVLYHAIPVMSYTSDNNLCLVLVVVSDQLSNTQLLIQIVTVFTIIAAVGILSTSNLYILRIVGQSTAKISVRGRDNRSKAHVIASRMLLSNLPTLISCVPVACVVSLVLLGFQLHEALLQWVIIVCVPQAAVLNPLLYAVMKLKTHVGKAAKGKK